MGTLRQHGPGTSVRGAGRRDAASSLRPWLHTATHLESFSSICCRISCLSSSVLLGKIFLSSSSCLLGRFRSFTAKSSFLHFLGSVPECHQRGGGGDKTTGISQTLACCPSHPAVGRRRRHQGNGGTSVSLGFLPAATRAAQGQSDVTTHGPHVPWLGDQSQSRPPGTVLVDTCCPGSLFMAPGFSPACGP